MPDATHDTLREQVRSLLPADTETRDIDAVLAVFAERERLLRERIEAIPDLDIQGTAWIQTEHVLAVFDA